MQQTKAVKIANQANQAKQARKPIKAQKAVTSLEVVDEGEVGTGDASTGKLVGDVGVDVNPERVRVGGLSRLCVEQLDLAWEGGGVHPRRRYGVQN